MGAQGPLSGQKVADKYLFGELLGEGAFGAVYKAQHLYLQRQQAIKVLFEHYFRRKEFRERFLREAQTVAALDHPFIIHLDDFWIETSCAYLVMPLVTGGTFQDVLKKQKILRIEQVIAYLEYICAALDYAHKKGIAHLDLKPLNLLVHEDGRVLLSDFGLAHLITQEAIEGGSSLGFGTPHYMAPEHIQKHPEKRSDLFSLGVLLYQMVAGRRPFEGLSPEAVMIKNMTEWPQPVRTFRSELPQEIEKVLRKAVAKQPEQRYQTANDLLIAFKKALIIFQQPILLLPSLPMHLVQPGMYIPITERRRKNGRIYRRITASQVPGVLMQAYTFQTQEHFQDAIDLCEQILESGFDQPNVIYYLGCLYQEEQRWDDAILLLHMLLDDPDYALSCHYALGECYRACGDLRTAAAHFVEAVDLVNLDALIIEEAEQLMQLCQEAADAHCMLGEQEEALTVYRALLGFFRSRGSSNEIAKVESMLQQIQKRPICAGGAPPTIKSLF